MTRFAMLARRPKRTLAALGLALAAVGIAGGSSATFSAQSASPSNTFSAGILSMTNSREGAAVLTASDMRPGAPPQKGTVDIANSGSLPGNFQLARDMLTSSDGGAPSPAPFASKVEILVVDCGRFAGGSAPQCGDADDTVAMPRRPLSAMDPPIGLGLFEPGERHRYEFSASLPASVGNEYAGDGAGARFVWEAVQAS